MGLGTRERIDFGDFSEEDVNAYFMSFVKDTPEDECWLWDENKLNNYGYGIFRFRKREYLAHRASLMLARGDIPKALQVCHECDVPRCVNPSHLFVGSAKDNAQDRERKGRSSGGKNRVYE